MLERRKKRLEENWECDSDAEEEEDDEDDDEDDDDDDDDDGEESESGSAPAGAEAVELSGAEKALLSWVSAVCGLYERRKQLEPSEHKVAELQRKLTARTRDIERDVAKRRQRVDERAAKANLPADLFPLDKPWGLFPWEEHFRARSECEDALRQAIGLRELPRLTSLLASGEEAGLTRMNSSVFFDAVELCELLQAEGAASARSQDAGLHEADPPSPAPHLAAAEEPGLLMPRREKTEAVRERLNGALDVFIEPVETQVSAGVPKLRPFKQVLAEKAAQFEPFMRSPHAAARRAAILGSVSDAAGVTDIETEQCREQEQEKEQEQEQEAEVEMERYVDMNYQRDNEEPQRWAFVSLAEAEGGRRLAAEPAAEPVLLGDGTFYKASEFHLHARAPLPFPAPLRVSRNHFNLQWVGERRLKNCVMVMEYVPSVKALRTVDAPSSELSAAQSERLHNALALLDLQGGGRFGATELGEALRSAEDLQLAPAELEQLMAQQTGAEGSPLSAAKMRDVLVSGKYRREQAGRHFVLLSLAEAATIRCILHQRQGRSLIDGADVAVALRCISAGDVLFDTSSNYSPPPAYMRQVQHTCFRLLDSHMHFAPPEINLLLRSIPAPPAQRRLFFKVVTACRRRLAKRWEQTPLAKLFTLEDEWSMLKQRAQAVRVREAIKARGLLLHDAFLKFDYDRNGHLSLAEMYGALEWLQVPNVTPADILFFVRGISREASVSYADFMALLCSPEEAEVANFGGAEGADGADDDGPPMVASGRQRSRVAPKGEAELQAMLHEQIMAERALDAELETQESSQLERSRRLAESQVVESSFGWMAKAKALNATNPRTTRTSCFYDFTRGVVGGQRGAPLWMEGRGKWLCVRQGSARVPCLKGFGAAFVVLRVPFRKNGSGLHLNQYTVTVQCRFSHVCQRGVLATAGWDQWSKVAEGDDDAQLFLNAEGGLGAHGSFGDPNADGRVASNGWHALSCAVDNVAGVLKTYVDGVEVAEVRSAKVCKDGQHALKGRVALFYALGNKRNYHNYYLRSVTVHSRLLSSEQARSAPGGSPDQTSDGEQLPDSSLLHQSLGPPFHSDVGEASESRSSQPSERKQRRPFSDGPSHRSGGTRGKRGILKSTALHTEVPREVPEAPQPEDTATTKAPAASSSEPAPWAEPSQEPGSQAPEPRSASSEPELPAPTPAGA